MLVARTAHQGARPAWDCEVCGEPWPCAIAKVELADQYRGFPHGLLVLLASYLIEAIDDWAAATGGPPPDLYERFINWTPSSGSPRDGRGAYGPRPGLLHGEWESLMTVTRRNDPAALRAAMVGSLRAQGLLSSEPVAAALSAVPRHLFAPHEKDLVRVYDTDATLEAVLFADGTESSVVSAPHIQAIMLEMAGIEPGMSVLEIGSGGYNAALIAEIVGPGGRVTTVDIDAGVVQRAKGCLAEAGYERVTVVQADAEHGVAEHAPYDRILVTVGAWDIPGAWLEQLTDSGRIVVPLRFSGITRLIAFDRTGQTLTASGYRLGAFVPMQGDGAVGEELVGVTEDIGLRLEPRREHDFSLSALREALRTPAVDMWAGTAFDMPDELALFLLTTGGSGMVMLHAAQKAVDAGVVDPAVRHGLPALVRGGSFAYRIKRSSEAFASGYEAGVRAHGPDADAVGRQLLTLIREWGTDHFRRGAARVVYYPAGSDISGLAGWRSTKRHGTLAISWP